MSQLTVDRRPMRFVHQIVMASVYDAMPFGQRSMAHTAAALLLEDEGADAEEIALHLLATEPGSSLGGVRTLRDAAAAALTRGAPESAIAYLRRGVVEASDSGERAHVVHELARAESMLRDPHAIAHLQEAMVLTVDPLDRGRVARELVEALMFAGRWDAAFAEVERAIEELGDRDAETAARLEVFRAGMMSDVFGRGPK
jgi:hypothetical protein